MDNNQNYISFRELAKLLEMSNYQNCLDKMSEDDLCKAVHDEIKELLLHKYQNTRWGLGLD